MSASGPESQPEPPARDSEEQQIPEEQQTPQPDEQQAPTPGSLTQRSLLEQVLRQTALSSLSEEKLSEQAMSSLVEVARRYRGQPLVLEPVAVDLVHAALEAQFEMFKSVPRDWRSISARIAQTLFEDEIAREQLDALWKQLSAEE